jgi:hypothetical protein
MTKAKEKKLLRLTRSSIESKSGRPRILVVDVTRVDGVVTEPKDHRRTQVVMLNGTAIYVREEPDEILAACEALGCPVGIFTKQGAKEAMRDCLE